MATTNDLKNGMVLNLDGQLWAVTEFQHVKPGKGGAFVRTTLKNVLSGQVVDRTFNAGTKVDTATVDKRDMTYLYADGDDYVFMDSETYDQVHVPGAAVGDAREYLLENMTATVATHDNTVLYVELPASVERADPPAPAYAGDLVRGVTEHADRIDTVLTGYTGDWPLGRLPSVDRAILRLATFELLWQPDVPPADAIDEAVELAKSLST